MNKKKLANIIIVSPSYEQILSATKDLYKRKEISKSSFEKIKKACEKKSKEYNAVVHTFEVRSFAS